MEENGKHEENDKKVSLKKNISDEERTKKKRENLFKIQTIITTGILSILGFTFLVYYDLKVENPIKIVFAPFLSVVPLLFILTILKDWVTQFSGKVYPKKQILNNSGAAILVTIVFVFTAHYLSIIQSVEILVAVLITILSIVAFISFKVKDIKGMAIITGIAEGLIIYMVFMF